ncbi:MAG TPA: hypothetical protein PK760_13310 [Flavobacteriales bacterium]|nr:hypothetical protein [Flavobacteriales bacterium]
MRADIKRVFIWMTVFYIAMAYLESAVVVYLRALYYPEGFDFPLVTMDHNVVGTEVWREVATIIMLLAPAALVTRSRMERFAWFCFGFGIWDIFYYVWLKVILDWPASLASRDLLFLVPVPWVGPVWAPCVISMGLIAFALVVLYGRSTNAQFRVDRSSWLLLLGGAMLMIVSFTIDPFMRSYGLEELSSAGSASGFALANGREYIPEDYPWPWFVMGCTASIAAVIRIHRQGQVVRSPSSMLKKT